MSVADKLLQLNQVKQDIKTAIEMKGIDLTGVAFTDYANKILEIGIDVTDYFNYAKDYYTATNNLELFLSAWEHSLTVEPTEISATSLSSSPRGKAQYPNGDTEGVIIPQSVTSIGGYAFYVWTSNNKPLVIPNSVTSISNNAFMGWNSNINPLVIPDSVTSIGDFAFFGWRVVPYIEIRAITPPTLAGYQAFTNQNDAPIYVPDESVDDYKTATNWVNLADRIFSINDK